MARNVQNLGLGLAQGQARMSLEQQQRAERQRLVAQALGQIQAGNQQAANVGMQMQQLEAVAARQAAAQKARAAEADKRLAFQGHQAELQRLIRERQLKSQEQAQRFSQGIATNDAARRESRANRDQAAAEAFGSAGRVRSAQESTPEQALLDPLSVPTRQQALDEALPGAAGQTALQESLVAQDDARARKQMLSEHTTALTARAKSAPKPLDKDRRDGLKEARTAWSATKDIADLIHEEGAQRVDEKGRAHGVDFAKFQALKRLSVEAGLPPIASSAFAEGFNFDAGLAGVGSGAGGQISTSRGEYQIGEAARVKLEKLLASFTPEEQRLAKLIDQRNRALAQKEPGVLTDADWQFYSDKIGLSLFDGPAIFQERFNKSLDAAAGAYVDEVTDNVESGFQVTSPFMRTLKEIDAGLADLHITDDQTGAGSFVPAEIDQQQGIKDPRKRRGSRRDLGERVAENIEAAAKTASPKVADATEESLDATASYIKDQVGLVPEAKKAGANVLVEKYNKATTKEAKKVAGQELAQYFSDNGPVEKVRVMWGMLTGEKVDNTDTRTKLEADVAKAMQMQGIADRAARRYEEDGNTAEAARARAQKERFIKMEQDAKRALSELP